MNSQIKFETTKQSEIYPLPQVWISPLKHNHKFILGMNFIRNLKGGIVLTQNYVQIFKRSIQLPTNHLISWKQDLSELALAKRSGTLTEPTSFCPSFGKYDESLNLVTEEENWSSWENNEIEPEELDNFDTTFCFKIKEKLEKAPKFRRNSKEKLDSLIKIAEETQVLGEDPIKYWNRNKILAHLDIKNVDYNIKTAKGDYTPLDVEEFGKQIKELLDLKVIRKSSSRHRSTAFLVRNHAEIKRGKARMVINYKRLNDNTHIDSYDIPSKDMLINCI